VASAFKMQQRIIVREDFVLFSKFGQDRSSPNPHDARSPEYSDTGAHCHRRPELQSRLDTNVTKAIRACASCFILPSLGGSDAIGVRTLLDSMCLNGVVLDGD
jgi:hypothetical protein